MISAVVVAAASFLTTSGAPTPAVPVSASDDMLAVCGAAGAEACAYPDRIVFSGGAALAARAFDRAIHARNRRRAFQACGELCSYSMLVTLHELVHVDRMRVAGRVWDQRFEEGLAQSVALDQVCRMERMVSGGTAVEYAVPAAPRGYATPPRQRVAVCAAVGGAYPGWTAFVRRLSAQVTGAGWWSTAARSWRLMEVTA